MSKIANDIRVGNIIIHEKRLWKVLKTEHVKPGKGGAFVQMEMKEIKAGTKLNQRFRSEETIDVAHYEMKDYQYLFRSGNQITLMDTETFEQIEVDAELFNGTDVFLQDGMNIVVDIAEEQMISASVPAEVTLLVTEAEAVVKGQTAAGSNKPAILENGVRVMVPQFVATGDKIVVKTENSTYVKRAE
ncbi:MAG: elongation factor P [Rickettsiales bacterium]|nr:elongation factor P [Rickettsiales bacterium]